MVKKEIQYNEEGAASCKHCKRKGQIVYPRIVEISGEELYYAQCPKCKHWDLYEFLGTTRRNAIKNWNSTMLNKESL